MSENSVIHVGGLSVSIDESILYAAFLPFGEIKSIDLPHDQFTSSFILFTFNPIAAPKGYAFVEYEDPDDCRHAIDNMNGAELMGKVLHVSYAKNPKFREGSNKPVWADERFIVSKTQAEEKEGEPQ